MTEQMLVLLLLMMCERVDMLTNYKISLEAIPMGPI